MFEGRDYPVGFWSESVKTLFDWDKVHLLLLADIAFKELLTIWH